MAAKHDGKKARANFWVMQQNLAKQKGGKPGWQFGARKEPRLPKPIKTAAVEEKAADAGATATATVSPETTASTDATATATAES